MNSGKKNLEVYSSLIFSDTAKLFGLYAKSFSQDYQLCFLLAQMEFWEKFLFEICASHTRISNDNRCGFIAQNFSVGLSNLNPKCADHPISEKKLVIIFINFFIFGLWAVTSQTIDKKNNDWVAETALYAFRDFLVMKTFSPEKLFPCVSDFELMIFGHLVKKFGRLTKTALYVSREDFRRKKIPN